jgi:hypothetical protein
MERTWVRKTISVALGKEDYIIALMNKVKFIEEDRTFTGGHMSEEKIQITFGGYNTDYHENDYVKVKTQTDGYSFFYSLRRPDGYFTNSEEAFRGAHDKAKEYNFEICSFPK